MAIDLQIAGELESPPVDVDHLQRVLGVIDAIVGGVPLQAGLCVRICGEAEARELNSAYRGIDSPTNVLSFTADVDVPDCPVLGDLAICWPVLVREAAQQKKNVESHFMHLFVHGVLHLLGMDHEQDEDARRMESAEVRVLAELGIADPYEPCP